MQSWLSEPLGRRRDIGFKKEDQEPCLAGLIGRSSFGLMVDP